MTNLPLFTTMVNHYHRLSYTNQYIWGFVYKKVVYMAFTSQEAVERVSASEAGEIDLILMDILMPVMDGYAASRAIRALPEREKAGTMKNLPDLPIRQHGFSVIKKVMSEKLLRILPSAEMRMYTILPYWKTAIFVCLR